MATGSSPIFKIWTAILSIVFAGLLFPNIVDIHGPFLSLVYTGLGVGFIWLLYFGIGQFIQWAVSEELKNQNLPAEKKRTH